MFTGIVERSGSLRQRERRGPGFQLRIAAAFGQLSLGESVCVSGACLTVVASDAAGFTADVSLETAERTTLGRITVGSALNLERSLRFGDRLGGHLLSGHVDGLARLVEDEPLGESHRMRFAFPRALAPLVAVKGSVGLDGVSLTVNAAGDDWLDVMLIPHTLAVTSLGGLKLGGELNFEVDMLARYVARYLEQSSRGARLPEGDLSAALERAGFASAGGGDS